MEMQMKKAMDSIDFAQELFGFIPVNTAKDIYKRIDHYPEMKKNIIIDLLRANPQKYVPALLGEDE